MRKINILFKKLSFKTLTNNLQKALFVILISAM